MTSFVSEQRIKEIIQEEQNTSEKDKKRKFLTAWLSFKLTFAMVGLPVLLGILGIIIRTFREYFSDITGFLAGYLPLAKIPAAITYGLGIAIFALAISGVIVLVNDIMNIAFEEGNKKNKIANIATLVVKLAFTVAAAVSLSIALPPGLYPSTIAILALSSYLVASIFVNDLKKIKSADWKKNLAILTVKLAIPGGAIALKLFLFTKVSIALLASVSLITYLLITALIWGIGKSAPKTSNKQSTFRIPYIPNRTVSFTDNPLYE